MENLLFFCLLFVLVFIVYLIKTLIKTKKKTLQNTGEITYLINKYNLDKKKLNYKALSYIICFVNAFIISFTTTVICLIEMKYIWQLLIGFVVLFLLILLIYGLIGKVLIKKGKGMKKNVRSQKSTK